MKKITLIVLIGFSLVLFGCNNQQNINDHWNLIDSNDNETLISDEMDILEEFEFVEELNNDEKVVEETKATETENNNTITTETNADNKTENYNLAKCLTSKWVVLYGMTGCPYCKMQIEMFGDDFQYINYINCSENPVVCTEKGITGVPAWEFSDGTIKSGLHALADLAGLAGCE